jgi:acylphosphatase
MIHSEISFRKIILEEGFGFACMKAAYAFGIKGRMIYGIESGVMIQAEGDQKRMDDFIRWLETNANKNKGEIDCKPGEYSGKFNEFDIYRQDPFPAVE